MSFIIAIDGPSGSGKSTVAKTLAKDLGILYIDTGAMYRSVALYCIRNNVDVKIEHAVEEALNSIKIDISYIDDVQRIFLNDEDVTEEVRLQNVAKGASDVAQIEIVRTRLVELQRQLANEKSVVMDGRDIGTVVFPNATLKIYLEANVETRTKRRCEDLIKLGYEPEYKTIEKEIISRDFNDMNRKNSPLKKADGAILIDTSNITPTETVHKIKNLLNEVI